MQSFFWFDFETFGANPSKDKPSQFAGIRTDFDFNLIDEPVNIYCKPSNDFIPNPEACLITGITPQLALEKGLPEHEFFRQIEQQIAEPNTCNVGYNNIRFDDEVVRYGLYRNFYDAYEREWKNGNSRWDIIDLMRMTHALRPEGIHWPKNDEGTVSFRLELLSQANGIEHEDAHDALADVYATINMAKLVKQKQPKLFEYLLSLRDKRLVSAEVDVFNHKPFVHSSGMLGSQHQYTGVMYPICMHPTNKNSAICLNLTESIDGIDRLSEQDIQLRLFTRQSDLPDGIKRLAIKEVHFNKCPAVAPLGVLNTACQQRLGIDLNDCLKKADELNRLVNDLEKKLINVYRNHEFPQSPNAEQQLYSGGFFSQNDKSKMQQIKRSDWQELAKTQFQFQDKRLDELLFLYRARNAYDSLNDSEKIQWLEHRKNQFYQKDSGSSLIVDDYQAVLSRLKSDPNNDQNLLNQVDDYVTMLLNDL